MMDYQTLDTLADAYIPLIALMAAYLIGRSRCTQPHRFRRFISRHFWLLATIALAYLIMGLDMAFNIWSSFGLDYSTHTAVALAIIVALSKISPKKNIVWWSSLLLYCGLMLYQGYHSVLDIITTACTVGACFLLLAYLITKFPALKSFINPVNS